MAICYELARISWRWRVPTVTGRCVCVLQLLRLRWISKMMLWCRLWSTLSSDALGIAKCVMPESLQPVDALSSIDAVREPLGPATNAWNKCLPVLETAALEHVLCCGCRLERQPLRDSAVTPWLSPIRFPAHYSHLYPQSVNSPTLQPSNPQSSFRPRRGTRRANNLNRG